MNHSLHVSRLFKALPSLICVAAFMRQPCVTTADEAEPKAASQRKNAPLSSRRRARPAAADQRPKNPLRRAARPSVYPTASRAPHAADEIFGEKSARRPGTQRRHRDRHRYNAAKGEYAVIFMAENEHGKSERVFKLIAGDTLSLTPQMGFNDWYSYFDRVSDADMRKAADVMVPRPRCAAAAPAPRVTRERAVPHDRRAGVSRRRHALMAGQDHWLLQLPHLRRAIRETVGCGKSGCARQGGREINDRVGQRRCGRALGRMAQEGAGPSSLKGLGTAGIFSRWIFRARVFSKIF